ncbi:MAG: hypothetical protein Q7J32_04750 [Sphingomonadaceae bacterium]|nr:hypothetical protein [Sphingomonadaceae bacterium]
MKSLDTVLAKLDRPPAAQNWVRLNEFGDELKTAKRIADLALGMPPFNYIPSIVAIADAIRIGLARETAIKMVERAGAPAGREQNAAVVRAFYEHDEVRGYSRLKTVDNYQGYFLISREIRVPMRPAVTVIDKGHQVPVIFCGWKSVPLDLNQRRLLMTVLENGLFSFTDYMDSPGEVVFYPEGESFKGERQREPEVWHRGDYQLLSNAELREQVASYMQARELARMIIAQRWAQKRERQRDEQVPAVVEPSHPDLFKG